MLQKDVRVTECPFKVYLSRRAVYGWIGRSCNQELSNPRDMWPARQFCVAGDENFHINNEARKNSVMIVLVKLVFCYANMMKFKSQSPIIEYL